MNTERRQSLATRYRSEAEADIKAGLAANADPLQQYLDLIAQLNGSDSDSEIDAQASGGTRPSGVVTPYSVIAGRLLHRRTDRVAGVDRHDGESLGVKIRAVRGQQILAATKSYRPRIGDPLSIEPSTLTPATSYVAKRW